MKVKLIGYQSIESTNKETGEVRSFNKLYFTRPASVSDLNTFGEVVLDVFLDRKSFNQYFGTPKIGGAYDLGFAPNFRGQAELVEVHSI